jgi:hypothetical protein
MATLRRIPGWQVSLCSVVLVACRPAEYTVVDSRALRGVMVIEGYSAASIAGIRCLPPSRWM